MYTYIYIYIYQMYYNIKDHSHAAPDDSVRALVRRARQWKRYAVSFWYLYRMLWNAKRSGTTTQIYNNMYIYIYVYIHYYCIIIYIYSDDIPEKRHSTQFRRDLIEVTTMRSSSTAPGSPCDFNQFHCGASWVSLMGKGPT